MQIERSVTFDTVRAVNKLVALTPPVKRPIQAHGVKTGFATMANRQSVIPLKVVYPKGDLLAGMTVYVREGETALSEFAQIFKIAKLDAEGNVTRDDDNDNPEFVLVSEDRLVLVDLKAPEMVKGLPTTMDMLHFYPVPSSTYPAGYIHSSGYIAPVGEEIGSPKNPHLNPVYPQVGHGG